MNKKTWVVSSIVAFVLTFLFIIWYQLVNWEMDYLFEYVEVRDIFAFALMYILLLLLVRLVLLLPKLIPTAQKTIHDNSVSKAINAERETHIQPLSRSGQSDSRLPLNKREAEMMSAQWVKQAADSVKIINTTKKPSTFFERYDFFLDTLERLAFCEKWVRFQGTHPSAALRNAFAEQDEQIQLFIMRYAQDTREKMYSLSTQKAKLNKAGAYYNTLTEYSARISDENVLLFTEQYELLKGISQ